ncbi:MAG: membrane protein insertase YidC [Woeseiaceae bacterium]
MDNQRLLIWATFALLGWMTYVAWMEDYGPKRIVETPATSEQTSAAAPLDADVATDLPDFGAAEESELTPPGTEPASQAVEAASPNAPVVTVQTDVFKIEISTEGGTVQSAVLLKYPVAKDQPDTLIELLSTNRETLGLIRTGILTDGASVPDHNATFAAARSNYELGGQDEIVVPLRWTDEQGVSVEKRFTFRRGSYAIDLQQTISNASNSAIRAYGYTQMLRRSKEQERSMFDVDSYSFDGVIVFNGEKSEKLKRDDLIDDGQFKYSSNDGWFGFIQHHFLSAVVPSSDDSYEYNVQITKQQDVEVARVVAPTKSIAAGQSETFAATLFVGPKLQSQLEKIHEKLKLTVDYGWLTIISNPLFWLLSFVFGYVGNWGVAIILVTVLIKLAFYKLTEASGRSMAKMRNLQPRMKALQDRYKDDRQALSQAMMELYKREKVNPAAGCLPILIQMPFFLAFYWVLLESVEMRQAPFALWITDLSSRDPFFILPLIMGAAMFFQQKLNPAPTDPVQAKVMQIMPVMFTGFFAFFPSGLVLYWVTNTLLSIAQQWKINKVVEAQAKAPKGGKKKGK